MKSAFIPLLMLALAACAPVPMPVSGQANLATPDLQVEEAGGGNATVIFVHGNGNATLNDWATIVSQISENAQTVTYDREGHGKSPPLATPYSFDSEVASLVALVERYEDRRTVYVVAHSFGGMIASIAAEQTDAISGIVFVDASVPGAFTDEMAQRERDRYRPQYGMLEERVPELAKAIIPRIEAFPEIAQKLENAEYSGNLPTVVIMAEGSTYENQDSIRTSMTGSQTFVDASPWRHMIHAKGSSHQVMRDRPDVVIAAIEYLLKQQ
ncbi:alpha/beta fold hydrolase [Erythrobacter sp. HA6-11]